MELVCTLTDTGDTGAMPVLHVSGEIDLATLPALRDQLTRAVSLHGGRTLAVDLDGLIALDDTGMGMLLGAAGRAREQGGDLVLVCTNDWLRHRFAVTGLDRAVQVLSRLPEHR